MEMRKIALDEGTTMGDYCLVFETNAPIERLKQLENECNQIYINGGDDCDIPIWADILKEEGYVFKFVDEHCHTSQYATSSYWLEVSYPDIKEHYVIENQPNLSK